MSSSEPTNVSHLGSEALEHLSFFDSPDKHHLFFCGNDAGPSALNGSRFLRFTTLHSCEKNLIEAQKKGCGVFVSLHRLTRAQYKTDGESIREVRALWLDFDEEPLPALPMPPSLCIKTQRGYHVYYKIDPSTDLDLYDQIQYGLSLSVGSDSGCKSGLKQMVRLAGTYHLKNQKRPFLVKIVENHPARVYALDDFRKFATVRPPSIRASIDEMAGTPINPRYPMPFPLLRSILNDACKKVRCAQVGERHTILHGQSYRLGCFVPLGLDRSIASEALSRAANSNPAFKFASDPYSEIRPTIDYGLNTGIKSGKMPFIHPSTQELWDTLDAQQKFYASIPDCLLSEVVFVSDILEQTPYNDIFSSEREAAHRIGQFLESIGYERSPKTVRRLGKRRSRPYVICHRRSE